MTKKEEFGLVMFRYDNREIDFGDVCTWIENEIRQAKIEENKRYSQLIDEGYGYNGGILNIVFKNRISELEKEKK